MKHTGKDRFTFVGLLTASFACLLVLLGQDTASAAQLTALVFFALSVPALTVCAGALYVEQVDKREALNSIPLFYRVLGIFGAIIGIGASFWHFGEIVGIAFVVSSVFALKMSERVPWIHETTTVGDKDT